jgi:uncharacterized protein (TIGR02996 family)
MQEEDFLGEICARGHDPKTYGAFADWLEEQSDPRAEYARIRGELAAVCGDDPRFHVIVQRLQGKPSILSPDDSHHQQLLRREQELRSRLADTLAPWGRRFCVERIKRLLKLTRGDVKPVSVYLMGRKGKMWPLRARRCLSESQVAKWEQKHKVELPEAYRMFLKEIGNGGKIRSDFVCQLDIYPLQAVKVGEEVHQPFPLTDEHARMLRDRRFKREKCRDPILLAFWQSEKDRGFLYEGSPPGCLGVGIPNADYEAPAHLVVTGEQRGKVWADRGGCLPERNLQREQVDFLEWFEWLLEMDTVE